MAGLVPAIHVCSLKQEKTWMPGTRPGMTRILLSNSRHIELRLLAGAVAPQRAVLADRVGTLEDPVLPGGQPREDFRFHRFRTGETQIGFHSGEAVRRERG